MEWFDPTEKLPEIEPGESKKRCLAFAVIEGDIVNWTGLVDVYFNPNIGWRCCCGSFEKVISDKNLVLVVKKWIPWKDIDIPKMSDFITIKGGHS